MYTEIGYMCIYYPLDAEWHDNNSLVVMVPIKFVGIRRRDPSSTSLYQAVWC